MAFIFLFSLIICLIYNAHRAEAMAEKQLELWFNSLKFKDTAHYILGQGKGIEQGTDSSARSHTDCGDINSQDQGITPL